MSKGTNWAGRIALFVGGALVLAAIGYGFVPKPPRVEVASATRGLLQVTVREEGKTRLKDRYVVSAPVPGFAQRLTLEVGDTVEQGQSLLEIQPLRSSLLDPRTRAEAKARVSVDEARLKVAEQRASAAASDAALANTELTRVRELQKKGAGTQGDLDRALAEARAKAALRRSAEFAVEVARHELEAARAALQYSRASPDGTPEGKVEAVRVDSPLQAKVLRLFHESEGVVAPGQKLVELGDPSGLEVEVEVLSADAVQIEPGMRVVFDRWGGADLEGKVRVVEPIGFTRISALGVEEQRVLVIVEIVSAPEAWQALGDGYRVEANFVLWEGADVLQIPNSALFRGGGGWQVYVYREGVAALVKVELGRRNGLFSEVKSGLATGDKVVTHPSDQIADGAAIRLRE
jgi:HlyD family secretion protein